MKDERHLSSMITLGALLGFIALVPVGCLNAPGEQGTEDASQSGEKQASAIAALTDASKKSKAKVLPRSAIVGERTQTEWSQEFQRWVYSIPAAEHPMLSLENSCNVGQSGPVFYISPFPPGPLTGNTIARTCDVPSGKFIFIPIRGLFNDYPCPDPAFEPAPGQTLEEFLLEGALAVTSQINLDNIEVLVDGQPVDIELHRITTPLFSFTGDLSLATPAFDTCVTGQEQSGVFDGWQIMIAPPAPGDHTVVTSNKASGRSTSLTLHISDCGDD
jgi:hypothetical protein